MLSRRPLGTPQLNNLSDWLTELTVIDKAVEIVLDFLNVSLVNLREHSVDAQIVDQLSTI